MRESSAPVRSVRTIRSRDERIHIFSALNLDSYRRLLAALHHLTIRERRSNIVLDFTQTTAALPGPMAALCAEALRLRNEQVQLSLILPNDSSLRRLFFNAGWAYLIDPTRYDISHFQGYTHVPATQFASATEQNTLVDRFVDTVMKSASGVDRADLAAMEWALNEIMDNVLIHSRSAVGGIVHLNNYAARKRVELVVADPGVGIPATLRASQPHLHSDARALEEAIREGVTRDKTVGQGNGLYGTFRISEESKSNFHIHSGGARLDLVNGKLKLETTAIPFAGTLVVAGMNYSEPATLAAALKFGGKPYAPADYIQTHYEPSGAADIVLNMTDETRSFGSRTAGTPVRNKLRNLCRMVTRRRIVLDFSGVPLVSSSFADEVIGKLFLELGPMEFMRTFEIANANPTVQQLINRAILQRGDT